MSENWTLSRGTLEDGAEALVLADTAYASREARAGRKTLLALNFPGTYMMQNQERRDAVLALVEPFLAAHDGVHVGGVTRVGISYTFLFYLGKDADRTQVPLPKECVDLARVWFAYDPEWREYSSYVPERQGLAHKISGWWKSLFTRTGAKPIESSDGDVSDDQRVIQALANAGSDISRPTDIVFYLYIPKQEDAEKCFAALWNLGYRANLSQPPGSLPNGTAESRWGVVSHLEAVPSSAALTAARQLMETLAAECAGEYDGWEAAVV